MGAWASRGDAAPHGVDALLLVEGHHGLVPGLGVPPVLALDPLHLGLVLLHLQHRLGPLQRQGGYDQQRRQGEEDDRHPKGRPQRVEPGQNPGDDIEEELEHQRLPPQQGSGPDGGTGSSPEEAQGWHRHRRRTASHPPRRAPWASSASSAYTEHDGTYRQAEGRAAARCW